MSNAGDTGLIAGQGAKIPHAWWPKKPKNIGLWDNVLKLKVTLQKGPLLKKAQSQ